MSQFYKDKEKKYNYAVGDKFWVNVIKTDSCWLWNGVKDDSGYGLLCIDSNRSRAHRYSYTIHNGLIPKGLLVRHSCDNPSCVNPDHLSLGTHKDNKMDSILKLRHAHHESNGRAVITTEIALKVKDMITNGSSPLKISEKLGISKYIVIDIKRGKTWNNL